MGKPKAAERLVWTVETMDIRPSDRVLEIGCGHGVAVTLICERLTSGSILAIDRSQTMIDMARQRNAAFAGASFRTASLHEADLGDARFDKVLAIHLPVILRGEPSRELSIIREHLAPGGQLFVSYQPLDPADIEPTVHRLTTLLAEQDMRAEAITHDLPSGRIVCVKARLA